MAPLDLSVVIPAYNEAEVVETTLRELSAHLAAGRLSYEIVVVDDGSTDETPAIVDRVSRDTDPHIRLLRQEINRGKGAALRAGVAETVGALVAFTDADLPYRMENLDEALELVRSGTADLAVGARDLSSSERDPSYPLARRIAGISFSLMVAAVLRAGVFDTQCGLKAFRGEVARGLFAQTTIDGFGFDFELMYLAAREKWKVMRVAVKMSHRHASKVRLVRDSLVMLRELFAVRARHRGKSLRESAFCPACQSPRRTIKRVQGERLARCRRCATEWLDPRPSAESLSSLYADHYYSSETPTQCGYAMENVEGIARTAWSRVAQVRSVVKPGSSVLEVGAGRGVVARALAGEFAYSGLELSRSAVEEARSEGLDVEQSALESWSTAKQFDAALLVHVFEHLSDPHAALQKLHALLRPEGALIIVTPDTTSWLARISGARWVSYKFPEHVILYSREGLVLLLREHGFDVVSSSADVEFCDRPFLLSRLAALSKLLAVVARAVLVVAPKLLPVPSGAVRVVAKRRAD